MSVSVKCGIALLEGRREKMNLNEPGRSKLGIIPGNGSSKESYILIYSGAIDKFPDP